MSLIIGAEPAIAIFAVCAIRLRPLIRHVFPSTWFSITEQSDAVAVAARDVSERRMNRHPNDVMLDELLETQVQYVEPDVRYKEV